jgi:predicted SnoaL-like aldol condensation-catalyzing enzyme
MIGIEITSKTSGIPIFKYEFRPHTLFDSEIRGGLITAIMQVMQETFHPEKAQKTRIVNYGQYNAILAEGKHTFGILFTFQTGPIFEEFVIKLIDEFENKYRLQLEVLEEPNVVIEQESFDFSEECAEAYNNLMQFDVSKLGKFLDLIQNYGDRMFENMLIYLRPEMSQIYTHLTSEKFSIFTNEVSTTIKTVLDLSNRTTFPIESFQIELSKQFYCLMFNVFPYAIIIFVDEKNLDIARWRIKEIRSAFVED